MNSKKKTSHIYVFQITDDGLEARNGFNSLQVVVAHKKTSK